MLRARDNPFCSDRVLRERYRFSESDWQGLMARLASRRGRGALVGPKGSGKTTLLEDLGRRLDRDGWRVTLIQLNADLRRIPPEFLPQFFAQLEQRDAVLLDGAEQLSLPRWLRFRWQTKRAGIVVATTHRAGRLPLLRRCTTSAALLRELVASLGQDLVEAEADALHQTHQGNIREALRELYDRHARTTAVSLSLRPAPV